jgi:hypothetical protein
LAVVVDCTDPDFVVPDFLPALKTKKPARVSGLGV